MRRVLIALVLSLAGWFGLVQPATADWACVAVKALDHASCVVDPLPDPLPLPDSLPVEPVTVGL